MFIKKFNSFLNESLQLDNGNIIDEEDVKDIFHDFLEDLPELKDAEIKFISNSTSNLEDGDVEIDGEFQIDFILKNTSNLTMLSDLYVRFSGFYHTPHEPLFKTDILDEIDQRMQDQFEYQLKDKTWYGGKDFLGVGFIFGKIKSGYKRNPRKEKSDYKGPMPTNYQPFRDHTPKRRIVNESLNYEYSHEQIKELLADFTDEHVDIQLSDQLGKKCIRLFYIFDIPTNCKIHEYGEKLQVNIDIMDEIVEKLEDCGYRVDYKGFWNSYMIHRHPKATIFCDIYNKNPNENDFKRKPIFVDEYYHRLLASRSMGE